MKLNKKYTALIAFFICICLLFCSCKKQEPVDNSSFEDIRGVWVSSVMNIDFPSQAGLTSQQMKEEIDDIIKVCADTKINAIFFQVRPCCDALYKSEIFPTSMYISEKQGAPLPDGFDPLDYMINQAHKKGISVHAWLNPYRVTANTNMSLDMLAPENPALKNKEDLVFYNGKYYLNPALESSIQLIVDGVKEIAENYEVDGIHFDDYFYPAVDFDDEAAFVASQQKDKHIWRCENVNNMLTRVYSCIKEIDSDIVFGVSPMGIWANESTDQRGSDTNGAESLISSCADSLAWIEKGIIDYICPQLYWTNQSKISNFDILFDWWANAVKGSNVKLLIGHALYKLGDESFPDFDSADVIINQLEKSKSAHGNIFYNYSCLKENRLNIQTAIKDYFSE